MTKEILENPVQAGKNARNSGMSIHGNPFRNYEGYAQEYIDWEKGWKEADSMDK